MALVVAYAAGILAYLLTFLGPIDQAEQQTLDWRFLFRGPQGEKSQEIVLVTVGEEANLPYWAPLPRTHLASVIRSLHLGGAKLIGVDFFLGKHSFDAQADTLLRNTIRDAGNVVLVSYLDRGEDDKLRQNLAMPFFQDAALDYGYATFFTDTGIESVREGTAALGIEGKHTLSLAGTLFAHRQGLDTDEIRALEWVKRNPALPGHDDNYRRVINYTGPPYQFYRRLDREMPGGIAAFHSHQVAGFPPPLAQRFFKDKIVLVGSGLSDTPDLYRTPFFSESYDYEKTFGVEIHAQFLQTLISPRQIEWSGFFLTCLLVLLPAFGAGFAAIKWQPYLALPITVAVILSLWILGFYVFESYTLVIPVILPTLSTALACLLGLAYLASTEGKQKDEVRDRFRPMLSAGQLEEVLSYPEAWNTEGSEQVVSVLWARLSPSDTRDPTLSAREKVAFFQDYWDAVSQVLYKHHGTIFFYEEGAVGAVFGAPIPLPYKDHAGQAAHGAVDLAEAWITFRRGRKVDSWVLSIGVDMGPAQIGELGTGDRHTYRVLGRPTDRARTLTEHGEDQIQGTQELIDQVGELVSSSPLANGDEGIHQITGRIAAPVIGSADKPANPFWKYVAFDRDPEDPVSEKLLAGLSIFSDFQKRDLHRIRPALYHRTYKAGERIFSQGEVGSAMYIIQSGQVDILSESDDGASSELQQRLSEGDFFGELALLSDLHRPASAVAYEPVELLVLFQADLYDLIGREPELGVRLIRSLSRIMGERLIHTYDELMKSRPNESESA
jgi:adenylate cyclase